MNNARSTNDDVNFDFFPVAIDETFLGNLLKHFGIHTNIGLKEGFKITVPGCRSPASYNKVFWNNGVD